MSRVADEVKQAIADPGIVVGPQHGPHWSKDFYAYAEEQETPLDWQTRAVLTVLVDSRYLADRPGNPLGLAMIAAFMFVIGLALGAVFL